MLGRFLLGAVVLLAMPFEGLVHAAQVCSENIAATAPDSRYQDNGDGTVTDLSTGLFWKQCAEGLSGADCGFGTADVFTWQQALQHAENAVSANSSQWRLPNKNELASLLELRCFAPAINASFFPNMPIPDYIWFWSSTPHATWSDEAWYIDFFDGYFGSGPVSRDEGFVRLVRGG